MEEDDSKQVSSAAMDDSLEYIFSTMIRQGDMFEAIDFIRSLDVDIIPSKTVIQKIIFEVLMKSDDCRCLALAYDYLVTTVLNEFPPDNEEKRNYYFDSVRDSQGYLSDLWNVVDYIVSSFFIHHSIYKSKGDSAYEPIKFPNCKFLLQFYVKLFSKDFEYLWCKDFQPCLVMMLFWGSNHMFLSNRTEVLLKWINDLYSLPYMGTKADLLLCLHDLLTLMTRCFLEKFKLSEMTAFRHPCLSEIAEATVNFCKNAFVNQENLKLFLVSNSLKCFQAKVSEKIIKQITRQMSKRACVATLNDIVNLCMFPQKGEKWKNPKSNACKEKNLRKRAVPKEKKASNAKAGPSLIHELVRQNKFGDLYQAIHDSPEDVNSVDNSGCTPLHEACKIGNYWTVNVLLTECRKDDIPNLDMTAANNDGDTALHLAIKAKSIEVAKVLLSNGGSELLKIADKKGRKPQDLSKDKEMDNLLQDYLSELTVNESDTPATSETDSATESSVAPKEAPRLKNFKDYSRYLHALTCLLGSYCDIFNVYDYVWKKNDVVKSHAEKKCCHYLEEGVCSEDAPVALQMPSLMATFIESLEKNFKKLNLNLDIELIPLRAFAAALKPS